MTQVIEDVDPKETITVHLLDQETKEEVKSMDIPIKDLQSNLTSTQLFHDGITLLIEYEITRDGKKVMSADDKLDELINAIGFGEKPWYLETSTLYSTLKLGLMRIFVTAKTSDIVQNQAVVVSHIVDFLKTSTAVVNGIALYQKYFPQAEAEILVDQIDTYINTGLEKFDFLTDHLRLQLADALSELRFAVARHVEWAKEASKSSSATIVEMTSAKVSELRALGPKFVDSAKALLTVFSEPQANLNMLIMMAYNYYMATKAIVDEQVKKASKGGKVFLINFLDKKFADDSTWAEILTAGSEQATKAVLVKAQPYVHKAVFWTTPLIQSVMSVTKPYLIKAAPYATIVASKVKERVENNPSAEKIFQVVTNKSKEAFEFSTSYAIPEQLSHAYDEMFSLKGQ
jgi:hypothetical protein